MDTKKRKWEVEYEKYINGEKDKEIADLNTTVYDKNEPEQIKKAKEKYKVIEKYNKVKQNISKVTNILELRDKLAKQKSEVLNEIKRRTESGKNLVELNKKFEKLEKELEEKNLKKATIKLKLKGKNISEEEKNNLKAQLLKLNDEIEKNNKEFAENRRLLDDSEKNKNTNIKFKNKTDEELEETKNDLSNKIGKCNLACSNLMNGQNWDAIEIKLNNWKDKQFKSTEKLSKQSKDENQQENELKSNPEGIKIKKIMDEQLKNTGKEVKKIKEQEVEEIEQDDEEEIQDDDEKSLTNISEFEKKHPRLAKIRNWFSSIFKSRDSKKIDVKNIPETPEKVEEAGIKRDEFTEYLKVVSEKGIEEIAKEKLQKAKEEAVKRQNEKLGEDYSKKSRDEI